MKRASLLSIAFPLRHIAEELWVTVENTGS